MFPDIYCTGCVYIALSGAGYHFNIFPEIAFNHKDKTVMRPRYHYNDITMDAIASQINSLTIVYSTVYSDADQRKHQSSASLAFFRGIHRGPVNSPHKWPVTRKMFPFDDVIMIFMMGIHILAWQHLNIETALSMSVWQYTPNSPKKGNIKNISNVTPA